MTSLFHSINLKRREALVKESLTSELLAATKQVQIYKVLEENDTYSTSAEASRHLIIIVEAIFIHGLKEKLKDRFSSAISDLDRRPEPEFWSPMMVYSHKHVIKQIYSFNQITSDVGRSRTWIRLSLNDGMLLSYFQLISQNNKALRSYYKKTAFLLDFECLETARNLLQGISQFTFSFPTNSSILNKWSDDPLLRAGLWTPPMKDCPIQSGFDVVQSIPDEAEDLESAQSLSGSEQLLLGEEEALKIILSTPIDGSPLLTRMEADSEPETQCSEAEVEPSDHFPKSFESPPAHDPDQVTKQETVNLPIVPPPPPKPEPSSTLLSYNEVLENYNSDSPELKQPGLQHLLLKYENQSSTSAEPSEYEFLDGFEVVSKPSVTTADPLFANLVDIIRHGQIVRRIGLDSQNFECRKCRILIGITDKPAKVCSLTGYYYCSECFQNSERFIPARILHNWDFMKYTVSQNSAEFLDEIHVHPLFDFRKINPRIYFAVEELAAVQKLRMKLNLLRPYLFTCRDSIKDRIQKMLWPREYLYEHVHLYSLADLIEVANGTLQPLLYKTIAMGTEHVASCQLCSQKGFICEMCKIRESMKLDNVVGLKPIYPFDIEDTLRCLSCKTVFHAACMKEMKDNKTKCPKCKRIEERKSLASDV